MRQIFLPLLMFFLFSSGFAMAESGLKNLFASVYLKGDKIGHVHLTTRRNENNEVEELKANASVSFLGMEVYGFTQNLNEKWTGGELQAMDGKTDDNGTAHEVDLKRGTEQFDASYNDKPLTLPLDAFPTSPWHYDITQNKLLFNIVDFDLLNVMIKESKDTVKIGEKEIKTSKFEFTGDWVAVLWFDENKDFVKGEYDVSGRQVTVILD